MNTIFTLSQFVHITAGALALVLFWMPAMLKKGSANHSRVWPLLCLCHVHSGGDGRGYGNDGPH